MRKNPINPIMKLSKVTNTLDPMLNLSKKIVEGGAGGVKKIHHSVYHGIHKRT